MRALITTWREGEWSDKASAACRPRPKRERRAPPPPRPNPRPVWPAFLAARITSPTKLVGLPAPRPPSRMRPGRMRNSSSWLFFIGGTEVKNGDGGGSVEFADLSGKSASRPVLSDVQKTQSNQPHAPCRRRRFYLAIRGSCFPPPAVSPSNPRQCPPDHDKA